MGLDSATSFVKQRGGTIAVQWGNDKLALALSIRLADFLCGSLQRNSLVCCNTATISMESRFHSQHARDVQACAA
jgi:hypothetical protein